MTIQRGKRGALVTCDCGKKIAIMDFFPCINICNCGKAYGPGGQRIPAKDHLKNEEVKQ